MMRAVIYQPIINRLKFTLHRARVLNNVVITTVIKMVEMGEILDERVGKRSVERVRYVINILLHLVIDFMLTCVYIILGERSEPHTRVLNRDFG